MTFRPKYHRIIVFILVQIIVVAAFAQRGGMVWTKDGNAFYSGEDGGIAKTELPSLTKTTFLPAGVFQPAGADKPLRIEDFSFSDDLGKLLIFTNSKRVWRQNTRGDYWVLDPGTKLLRQLGKGRPESSLMFAKISPDGTKAAYVSEHNVYVEDLATGSIKKLTSDNGTKKLINGTFDWVYEEEFNCRDGFRWAPDSKRIAYWQIDANQIRDFFMVNNTDSIYSQIVPVEYPKVGDAPSPAKAGVVDVASGQTTWMQVPGDPAQHYIVRMEWAPDGKDLILQQLNRKQNESKLYLCDPVTGAAENILTETDEAWVSTLNEWLGSETGWFWVDGGKSFIWMSEKDGWSHLYLISRDGKQETLLTRGKYDVISLDLIDEKGKVVYFSASPQKATQKYLYQVPLSGKGVFTLVSPAKMEGRHSYTISPNGKYALQRFTNYYTQSMSAWVSLPNHQPLPGQDDLAAKFDPAAKADSNMEFFEITTEDNVTVDGWMMKPKDFDPQKKYPVVFEVYSYPGSSTVMDYYGVGRSSIYDGNYADDGYLYISLDNRGSALPKGREWRKSVYRKVGQVNSRDQAMAAKQIMAWDFVDTSRVAVWGWSGGGSSTLDLLFRYPEIYKTGIAVAPVTSLLLYDNIYTERYMGLPQENMEDYLEGSAITYAKNLQGHLLLVHGTGDDNVHFQNSEMLVNELIKYNKQFQYMAYPMRSHGIFEGEGTRTHLRTLCTNFLREYCPPGGVPKVKVSKP
ncbi:MAG: S9 family peptidase [Saprospiraceae bacterium]|nr:MAG: S9 family peptidase [Saprospiraceae bacterium]